jgi:hypothetical protein
MPNYILSNDMNLPIPVVGVEIGPNYANDINNCMTVIDGHTHAFGSGVLITTSALDINTDLTIQTNNLTNVRSLRFTPQSAPLSLVTDIGCIYESGVDLWYNDGLGNQVRITSGGGVAGSPGSISGLTSPASASYNSGSQTFVWQSNTNTAANMDAGSYILRNIVANSYGLTLSPPTLTSNYTITLPQLPSSTTSFLTIDTSGNIGTTLTTALADSVGETMDATGANAVANSRTRAISTVVGVGGIAISASSGGYVRTGGSGFQPVTNLSVTITTTGRPVMLMLISDGGSGTGVQANQSGSGQATINAAFFNGATGLGTQILQTISPGAGVDIIVPSGSFSQIDSSVNGNPGTYTYTFQGNLVSGYLYVTNCLLCAYEL